jgi:hypothetical protein
VSANTLTGLIPTIYEALNVVAAETVGMLPAVSREPKFERAALNATVRSLVTPALTAEDSTPSNVSPNTTGQTISYVDVSITKSRVVPFNMTGEEGMSLGSNYNEWKIQNVAQALRTLRNEMETDLAALYKFASRAYGTAGTAPFGTAGDMTDLSNAMRILDDNGAPESGRRAVLSSAAFANLLGKQTNLFKVNEAGSDQTLRRGIIGDLFGAGIGRSSKLVQHVKGAGTGYDINNGSGEAIGQTTITLDGGTVNTTGIKSGDVVTFAGQSTANRYVVTTGLADVDGDIVLGAPGLLVAEADAAEMTIGGSYTPSLVFHPSAFHLAQRLPAIPEGGDAATERVTIVDPITGMVYEFAIYRQYKQIRWEVGCAWGVKAVNPAYAAIILG